MGDGLHDRGKGPTVGAIGLGCMGMTWAYPTGGQDDPMSMAVLRRALDLGVTLIDTADVYGPFTNEELVGRALRGRRDEAVLATKVGLVLDDTGNPPRRDGRPEHVREGIDASFQRLGVDHVDLYQLHRVDPDVALEETWGAMAETVAAGKARAIGLSEVDVDTLDRAQAVHPVASVQSESSLWTRGPIAEGVLEWCREHGSAFSPFSPLGRGFLTGTITAASFAADDFRSRNPRFTQEGGGGEPSPRRGRPGGRRTPRRHPGAGRARLGPRPGRGGDPHPRHQACRLPGGERCRRRS